VDLVRAIITIVTLGTLLFSCTNDQGLSTIDQRATLQRGEEVDIVVVIDTSCSMADNATRVTAGLAMISFELDRFDMDWQMVMLSADPDDYHFITVHPSDVALWEIGLGLAELQDRGLEQEMGFSAVLVAEFEHRSWFRGGSTLIIFISDEPEQSNLSPAQLDRRWPYRKVVVSIVGPYEEPTESSTSSALGCSAEPAPKYHDAADLALDLCSVEPWIVIEGFVEEAPG